MPDSPVKTIAVDSIAEQTLSANRLCDLLLERKLTISCAESATCGLVAKLLTDRPGSSAWFWGGAETYANEAKMRIVGVPSAILNDPSLGPVSEPCACAMADGIRALSGTDIALSVTGIAGPSGEEPGKPVGTVYIGLSSSFAATCAVRLQVKASDRNAYRMKFASAALILASQYIEGTDFSL